MEGDRNEKEAVLYLVLEHHYHLSRTDVMREREILVDNSVLDEVIARLNKNEPVQYVLGEADFYGRTFFVDSAVLIPRPETELLIRKAIEYIGQFKKPPVIVDVGTGSGCIAITLALEFLTATVNATDISEQALVVAKKNAKCLKANVHFHKHDILKSSFDFGPIDILVSNPPYITEIEKTAMHKNVIEYEPLSALFVPQNDPLLFFIALAEQGKKSLAAGGILITEINERFGRETVSLYQKIGYKNVMVEKDFDGKDRVVMGVC